MLYCLEMCRNTSYIIHNLACTFSTIIYRVLLSQRLKHLFGITFSWD